MQKTIPWAAMGRLSRLFWGPFEDFEVKTIQDYELMLCQILPNVL